MADRRRGQERPESAAPPEHPLEQAVEDLRTEHSQAEARDVPEEIPRFFNLQVDDWNMNQYGSMIPEADRARRMRQGEWMGATLPGPEYDHDKLKAERQPHVEEWTMRTQVLVHAHGELRDKFNEFQATPESAAEPLTEAMRNVEAAEAAEAAAREAAHKANAAIVARMNDEREKRRAEEAELNAVMNSPLPPWEPEETPQEYRRRVQLRRWRNQVHRQRMEAQSARRPFITPPPPAPDSDFHEPLPRGIYGSIQTPANFQPAAQAQAQESPREPQFTEGVHRMEHHPQPAEVHYFDPEACTRRTTDHMNGEPYQTTHPYLGKMNESGPKYANWSPHPHLCDMETLSKRFGSWRGSQALEIEPQVNTGNLSGERLRLGWGAEFGNVRYPPVGLCNEQQFVPTEHPGHVCRVDYNNEKYPCMCKCPYGIKLSGTNPSWPTTSRPGMPWYSMQGLKPEHQPHPFSLKAEMPAAGLSTENNVSLAYRNHPRCIMDPNLKQIVLSKTMGQFVSPKFRPSFGDILILQRPRCHKNGDRGFVCFYTQDKARTQNWLAGDQLVRIGKFINGRWTFKDHFKMFKLIQGCKWMIVGLLQRDRWFCPIDKPCKQRIETSVLGFWPRRGDLLTKALSMNHPSQLDWVVVPGTGPAFKPHQGDVILRCYVARPRVGSADFNGCVEMYVFDGVGMGWVFMGRDQCVMDPEGQEI